MLCMVDVPAFFTCRELIHFVSPMARQISQIKIIRDDTPNKYMVLVKFISPESTLSFYQQYNTLPFNSIESDKCKLEFVKQFETSVEENINDIGLIGEQVATEVPTCSVCLERMDDNVLIILCNHSFHAECLEKWMDTTCPVCRHTQTPELVPDQKCYECTKTTDLWMCMICGNVGCGRYTEAHAYQHYEKTSHIFALQVGGKLVWDYASDNYVHRLIQDSTDGKMVEFDDSIDIEQKECEKISAIQLEYTCLLTSQLENQRFYFQDKLREAEEHFREHSRSLQQKVNSLESDLQDVRKECSDLQKELARTSADKTQLEKKNQQIQQRNQKVQSELDDERYMCDLIRKDKETLYQQKIALEELRGKEITLLEEQVQDLMLHFETKSKLQEQAIKGGVSSVELEEGRVEFTSPTSSSRTSKRRTKKS